jgi:hypothetical protein
MGCCVGCPEWVRLFGDVGVGGNEGPVGSGHMGDWVCLSYLRVRYGSVGCRVETMCGWRWVPRVALNYFELVGVFSLDMGFAYFTLEVDGTKC